MEDLEKIKEFFLKDRAMTAAYEAKEEYFKPVVRKDKSFPNFLYVDIAYPSGPGFTTALGSKTMSGQESEAGATKALAMGNEIVKKLEAKYNIEDIEVKDLKNGKVQVFAISDDFNKMASPSLDEAKEEDKVDTITMDVPLFIRMLEYSREDAAEDMDLHDVTEKAISLGKERGILQMDDYDEIIGTTKEIKEVNLKQAKLSSAEYQQAKKLKDFKASDWKWNASEDLYTKVVKEGIERKITEALDKINEELCPAGKAYRKRRMAAGEKSSAYLSGRAVKVCKGQMSGKKKKK
jgi:hypothetical protein